jgi:hypothetical protein
MRAIHAARGTGETAEDVPATDDDRNLHTQIPNLFDLLSEATDGIRLNAKGLATGQHLSGDLEEDAAIGRG